MAYLIETSVLRAFLLTLDHDDEIAIATEREIRRREAEEQQKARASLS